MGIHIVPAHRPLPLLLLHLPIDVFSKLKIRFRVLRLDNGSLLLLVHVPLLYYDPVLTLVVDVPFCAPPYPLPLVVCLLFEFE